MTEQSLKEISNFIDEAKAKSGGFIPMNERSR